MTNGDNQDSMFKEEQQWQKFSGQSKSTIQGFFSFICDLEP